MTDVNTSPLVVLVHGAWHGAWCWAALQAELDVRGIASLAVDLPGHGASTKPLGDLYGDAAEVAAVMAGQGADRTIVLVGHSYGGAVITEAALAADNVAHLVYVAAFCLDKGEAVMTKIQSLPPVSLALNGALQPAGEGMYRVEPSGAVAAFYANCPAGAAAAAIARLDRQPAVTLLQTQSGAAWLTCDSTYVLCEQDQALAPSHQAVMAERCDTVVRLDTDHSPFTSMPVELAAIVESIVSRVTE